MKRLAHFLVLGALAFAALRGNPFDAPAREVVEMSAAELRELARRWKAETGRPPSPEELEAAARAAADEKILYREALRLRIDRTDAVVWERLVRSARFVSDTAARDEPELRREAVALGLDRVDPVIRRRLVQRVEAMLRAAGREEEPPEEELLAWLERHRERFSRPERTRLSHVFLSRERRGSRISADAAGLLSTLAKRGIGPAEAGRHGDPFLAGNHHAFATAPELAALFGGRFGAGLASLPERRWSGPLESAYGLHLVWVHERRPPEVPSLGAVRARVRHEVLAAREERALRRGLEALRSRYEVRISGLSS